MDEHGLVMGIVLALFVGALTGNYLYMAAAMLGWILGDIL